MPKRTPYKRNCDQCGNYYEGYGIRFCSPLCGYNWRSTHPRVSVTALFWAKVDTTDISGCWIWTAGKNSKGYGNFWANNKEIKAHRFSWELHYGKIPKGQFVCHHCDNPSCIRPSHLFVGSNQDNMNDMIAKERSPQGLKGEKHPLSKLTEQEVLIIRSLGKRKISQMQIAAQFGVHQGLISNILLRKTWKHI